MCSLGSRTRPNQSGHVCWRGSMTRPQGSGQGQGGERWSREGVFAPGRVGRGHTDGLRYMLRRSGAEIRRRVATRPPDLAWRTQAHSDLAPPSPSGRCRDGRGRRDLG